MTALKKFSSLLAISIVFLMSVQNAIGLDIAPPCPALECEEGKVDADALIAAQFDYSDEIDVIDPGSIIISPVGDQPTVTGPDEALCDPLQIACSGGRAMYTTFVPITNALYAEVFDVIGTDAGLTPASYENYLGVLAGVPTILKVFLDPGDGTLTNPPTLFACPVNEDTGTTIIGCVEVEHPADAVFVDGDISFHNLIKGPRNPVGTQWDGDALIPLTSIAWNVQSGGATQALVLTLNPTAPGTNNLQVLNVPLGNTRINGLDVATLDTDDQDPTDDEYLLVLTGSFQQFAPPAEDGWGIEEQGFPHGLNYNVDFDNMAASEGTYPEAGNDVVYQFPEDPAYASFGGTGPTDDISLNQPQAAIIVLNYLTGVQAGQVTGGFFGTPPTTITAMTTEPTTGNTAAGGSSPERTDPADMASFIVIADTGLIASYMDENPDTVLNPDRDSQVVDIDSAEDVDTGNTAFDRAFVLTEDDTNNDQVQNAVVRLISFDNLGPQDSKGIVMDFASSGGAGAIEVAPDQIWHESDEGAVGVAGARAGLATFAIVRFDEVQTSAPRMTPVLLAHDPGTDLVNSITAGLTTFTFSSGSTGLIQNSGIELVQIDPEFSSVGTIGAAAILAALVFLLIVRRRR